MSKTRIQESYLIGASLEQNLGGVPGHVYLETRGTAIHLAKLRQAWRDVLTLHGIQSPLNDYVACFDCTTLPPAEAEREVQQYRAAFAQRNTRTEEGHSCGLTLFRLPEGVDCLCFDLNLQVADPAGFQILLGQLAELYQGHPVTVSSETADPEPATPADVAYWQEQVAQMRPGTILEQQRDPIRMHHCRYDGHRRQAGRRPVEDRPNPGVHPGRPSHYPGHGGLCRHHVPGDRERFCPQPAYLPHHGRHSGAP